MKILVACEFSGVVRSAFAERGHDAWSCDLEETEIPGQHVTGDVREVMHQPWDLIIAHPECTYIANSGVRWLDRDIERWKRMYEACQFFRGFLQHDCPRVAIENPIPHKYALGWIGTDYTQVIQPWQYGHAETKATCLWLRGLPPLVPTKIMPPPHNPRVHFESPGPARQKNRSRTLPGIAEAMATQWGTL